MHRLACIGFACIIVLCSCVTSGVIINKQYDPGYTYITIDCVLTQANGTCIVYAPTTHDVPDSWSLLLRDDKQDRPVDKQDTGWVNVTQDDFDKYHLGDHYPR